MQVDFLCFILAERKHIPVVLRRKVSCRVKKTQRAEQTFRNVGFESGVLRKNVNLTQKSSKFGWLESLSSDRLEIYLDGHSEDLDAESHAEVEAVTSNCQTGAVAFSLLLLGLGCAGCCWYTCCCHECAVARIPLLPGFRCCCGRVVLAAPLQLLGPARRVRVQVARLLVLLPVAHLTLPAQKHSGVKVLFAKDWGN